MSDLTFKTTGDYGCVKFDLFLFRCAGAFLQVPMLTTLCGGIQGPQLAMERFSASAARCLAVPSGQSILRTAATSVGKTTALRASFSWTDRASSATLRWSIAMDTKDFEANLAADGYSEIETQSLQPRPGKGHHGHHFAIRGLVLTGTFTVTQDSQRVTYGPGEIFAVAQDHPHDEEVGPEGARVLVGRKYGDV
jgi:hypothetical protein